MHIVPRKQTPIPFQRIPGVIEHAFATIQRPITATQRANLSVLVGIETGRGKAVQNWNLGNITASVNYSGAAWRPPWFELADAMGNARLERLHAEMLAGRAPSAFRAYPSLEAGAADFARVLVHSFPEVLEGAKSSDPEAFRRALAKKYSHDYANAQVIKSIEQLQKEVGLTANALDGSVIAFLIGWCLYHLLRKAR